MSEENPRTVERAIIAIVAASTFINVLQPMIVMPLGPDFAKALRVSTADLPYLASSYAAAAAISGVLGAFLLDRFDRRRALVIALIGIGITTACAGFAMSFEQLLIARFAAGLCGGPANSLSFSIVTDAVPSARRGQAFGVVVGMMSAANAAGVPLGLRLARLASWRAPFFAIALGCVLVAIAARIFLPPLGAHIAEARAEHPFISLRRLFANPTVRLAYTMVATLQIASFLILPNLSSYVQRNLGFPRERIELLYFAGGMLSVGAASLAGRLVDRHGSFAIGTIAVVVTVVVTWFGFAGPISILALWAVFMGFMFALGFRGVASQTLISKVPRPAERARFQSIQGAVGQSAMAIGATLSGLLLSGNVDGPLVGMWNVALVSIGLTLLLPALLWWVDRGVHKAQTA